MHPARNITQTSGGKAHALKRPDFYCDTLGDSLLKELLRNHVELAKIL